MIGNIIFLIKFFVLLSENWNTASAEPWVNTAVPCDRFNYSDIRLSAQYVRFSNLMQHQFQIFSATPIVPLNTPSRSRRLPSPLLWICIIFPTISFRFHDDNSRCFATLLSPPLILSPQRLCLSAIFTYEQTVMLSRRIRFIFPLISPFLSLYFHIRFYFFF